MIRAYERRRGKAKSDPRYAYSEGDMVLLRGRRPNKLHTRAVGPYRFISYSGPTGTAADVEDDKGFVRRVSSTHLLPCMAPAEQVHLEE